MQWSAATQHRVVNVTVDVHINDAVSVVVKPRLDVDPDDFETADVCLERVFGDLANFCSSMSNLLRSPSLE